MIIFCHGSEVKAMVIGGRNIIDIFNRFCLYKSHNLLLTKYVVGYLLAKSQAFLLYIGEFCSEEMQQLDLIFQNVHH